MRDANKNSEPQIDRMGCYIGQVRAYEGVPLEQLAQGLCTKSYLCRVENGEREAGKLLTDALLQRLGKPVELFDRILDWDEYQQWLRRQRIWRHLSAGEVSLATAAMQAYQAADVLEHQFLQTAKLNLRALQGAAVEELRDLALAALLLTQPSLIDHGEPQLLSQNEGWLLLTYLELWEQLDGLEAVSGDYQKLLQLLCQRRYDARERVYLFPYVACHVIEVEFRQGHLAEALAICERALRELSQEKRLYAYGRLLEWKQRLFTALGRTEQESQQLLYWLNVLQAQGPAQVKLLVPYMERGNVYCLNQVIRERRKLLGLSQEDAADGICDVSTLSRIENRRSSLHKKVRKSLLRRVNMSGERCDYEVISDLYEDYILRSEIGRAVLAYDAFQAIPLWEKLAEHTKREKTNLQFLSMSKAMILECLPPQHPKYLLPDCEVKLLKGSLSYTLPLNLDEIGTWRSAILSTNELLILNGLARCYKTLGKLEKAQVIAAYARNCIGSADANPIYYEDLYVRLGLQLVSIWGDCGYYLESNNLARECLRVSLEYQDSARLAMLCYNLAWNLEQQMKSVSAEVKTEMRRTALSYLQQAYAAALISNDTVGQAHIRVHCTEVYGIDMSLDSKF